jgi:hypothetical protein
MKNILKLSLAVAALTWCASGFATILKINNSLSYDVQVYTENRQCGQWGWGFTVETIKAGSSISLCSGNEVTAFLIFPADNSIATTNRPVFSGRTSFYFAYAVRVPTAAIYVFDIVPSSRAGGKIDTGLAKGWITQKALDLLSAGNPITDPKVAEQMIS